MNTINLIIVGVGGQGILLTSRILGALALSEGFDIKVSEVHGMSQRGGSVITHVRMGENVHSPLVDMGEANYVLSFEHLESLRAQGYLKKGGTLIENTQRIDPMPVIMGNAKYPEVPAEAENVISLDALSLACQAGDQRAVNIVLLGVLSRFVHVDEAAFEAAIKACVPPKTLDINLRAFRAGRTA